MRIMLVVKTEKSGKVDQAGWDYNSEILEGKYWKRRIRRTLSKL